MAARQSKAKASAPGDLVLTRIFNAPRDLVWKAWTDPKHVARWWGPKDFTNPVCELDVRPNGGIRIHMRGPDGTIYPCGGRFREIIKPERLAFVTSLDDEQGGTMFEVLTTATFTDVKGKTKLTLHAHVLHKTSGADVHLSGMEEGWSQSLDRLADTLETLGGDTPMAAGAETTALQEFVVTRVFNAPRDLVWKAWTEADRLAHWWGPKGCAIRIMKLDVRPGGMFHYAMQYATGAAMWGRFDYREINAPSRLVWLNSFCDENGAVIRAPFSPLWPLAMQNTVTFTEHAGRTTVTLRAVPHEATEDEQRFFEGFFHSLEKGYGGTMDQLETYLAKETGAGPGDTVCPVMENPMNAEPQKEHTWLQKLVGEWTYEGECDMGSGQPVMKSSGSEKVRSMGGLWIVCEGEGTMPGDTPATTQVTLGFNPATGRFTGTWAGSMMTHLWVYDGWLDAAERELILEAEGPSFSGDGTLSKYRDIVEIVSDRERLLKAQVQQEDGTWKQFMTSRYTRKT